VGLPLFAAAGLVGVLSSAAVSTAAERDAGSDGMVLGDKNGDGMPMTIDVTGIIRDFNERTAHGGHPDFERRPDRGFGHYTGNVASILGEDRKPVFTGGGAKVVDQYLDLDGRPICYTLFDPAMGDVAGTRSQSDNGGIESMESFGQWYRDVMEVNLSSPLTLTLVLQEDGQYVFDDQIDPIYRDLGGFFPIDDQLLGNPGGSPDHNFHFTFELHMSFSYDADGDQYFKFIGDDDVWVFIDDRLVIDLGGVHTAVEQFVDLDRLGLEDERVYSIDFFFAERHRTQSNFRIETNIPLRTDVFPSVSAAFD
jgi:fibro-slime domain-containing protein